MAQVELNYTPLTKIKIIGNGPSRDLYRHEGVQYHQGAVCMCNYPDLPDPPFWKDYIAIVDRRTMDYLHKNNITLLHTVWTTPELHRLTQQWGWNNAVLPVFREKLMNSAATAAYYATTHYDEVDLWGCDSLWSDVTVSKQDKYITRHARPSNLHTRWRKNWETVWATGKQFRIFCPQGTEPIDYGRNVEWHYIKR